MTDDRIIALREQRGVLARELNTEDAINNADRFGEIEAQITDLDAKIDRAQKAEAAMASLAKPAAAYTGEIGFDAPIARAISPRLPNLGVSSTRSFEENVQSVRDQTGFATNNNQTFRSLGEQLQAVFNYYSTRGSNQDSRLVRAPTGASVVDPTGGGFLVQTDFGKTIFMLAHEMGDILSKVQRLPISSGADGIKIPGVDETSRANGSRWGGVQTYWADEGSTVTETKPKFRMVEFSLKKMMSIMYATDEQLQDAAFLTALAGQAFSEEIMFKIEDAIFEGSGTGQPLGIMNAPCKIAVAKEKGQAANTILYENILAMWSRMWARSRKNSAWYINQDIEPQLLSLSQAIGTGGVPVYLPPGGMSQRPYGTLLGRPVVPTEYNSTLGTEGDIVLADFSQYTLIDKNGVQAANSTHVAFLTDQQVFRMTYRVDGQPMWNAPLTPFKGTNTLSPFVTLATRA